MSASDKGFGFIERAGNLSPQQAVTKSTAGIILALGSGVAFLITAVFDGLASLADVFGSIRTFLGALIPTDILLAGEAATAAATGQLGLSAWIVGLLIVIGGFFIWDKSNVEIPVLDRFNFRGEDD